MKYLLVKSNGNQKKITKIETKIVLTGKEKENNLSLILFDNNGLSLGNLFFAQINDFYNE